MGIFSKVMPVMFPFKRIPYCLQAKRQRAAQTRPQQMTGHYAQATLSSRMKEIPPEDRPQPTSPKSPR